MPLHSCLSGTCHIAIGQLGCSVGGLAGLGMTCPSRSREVDGPKLTPPSQ